MNDFMSINTLGASDALQMAHYKLTIIIIIIILIRQKQSSHNLFK